MNVDKTEKAIGENVAGRLASIFTKVFGLPEDSVHPDLGPDNVERWDSMGHVMLVAAIQEEFSMSFEVDEIIEFTSCRAILSAIEHRLGESLREAPEQERLEQ